MIDDSAGTYSNKTQWSKYVAGLKGDGPYWNSGTVAMPKLVFRDAIDSKTAEMLTMTPTVNLPIEDTWNSRRK